MPFSPGPLPAFGCNNCCNPHVPLRPSRPVPRREGGGGGFGRGGGAPADKAGAPGTFNPQFGGGGGFGRGSA